MRPIHRLVVLLACTAAFDAAALSCGETIEGHVVLTADLHCSTGWTALYVATPGTTIDLNGHVLSGDRALAGISVSDAANVTITGGELRGFWAGINANRSSLMRIEGTRFVALGSGVVFTNADQLIARNNSFRDLDGEAVQIIDRGVAGGATKGQHFIHFNTVERARGGVSLCGVNTRDSVVSANVMVDLLDWGVHLSDGSLRTRVTGNWIDGALGGVRLAGVLDAVVAENIVDNTDTAVSLVPELGTCATGGARAVVTGTRVEDNYLLGNEVGIWFGLGVTRRRQVFDNRAWDNNIADGHFGLIFGSDAMANDARGNSFSGLTHDVLDEGRRNRW